MILLAVMAQIILTPTWLEQLDELLQKAAKLAADNDVPAETFMAAAWNHVLDSHPGMRQELEDKELRSQLKKLRKAGLMATA